MKLTENSKLITDVFQKSLPVTHTNKKKLHIQTHSHIKAQLSVIYQIDINRQSLKLREEDKQTEGERGGSENGDNGSRVGGMRNGAKETNRQNRQK